MRRTRPSRAFSSCCAAGVLHQRLGVGEEISGADRVGLEAGHRQRRRFRCKLEPRRARRGQRQGGPGRVEDAACRRSRFTGSRRPAHRQGDVEARLAGDADLPHTSQETSAAISMDFAVSMFCSGLMRVSSVVRARSHSSSGGRRGAGSASARRWGRPRSPATAARRSTSPRRSRRGCASRRATVLDAQAQRDPEGLARRNRGGLGEKLPPAPARWPTALRRERQLACLSAPRLPAKRPTPVALDEVLAGFGWLVSTGDRAARRRCWVQCPGGTSRRALTIQ